MIDNFESSTTSKTLNNIRKSLAENLKAKYNKDSSDLVDKILLTHGLHKSNFDFISNVELLINERLSDISIDDNSNKSGEKTIEGMFSEVSSSLKKATGYDYLYRQMKELYGKQEANFLMGEMLDFSLALSDSTNILKNYCWAADASKLVTEGRPFGILQSKPSKRISSYTSALCETTHQMANHLAGALAVGSYFLDLAHLGLFKENFTLSELRENEEIRKYLENENQQFVHSVNHLSRNGIESPFTNLSIFDRPKLRVLLSEKNYEWYFNSENKENFINYRLKKSKEKDRLSEDKEAWMEYVIDYIIELQNIFLDFFDKGDPLKGGMPYRFPVITINLSKKKWGEKWIIEDNEFLHDLTRRDIFRYNIFCSEGMKIASCCRLLSDSDMLGLADQVNSFGGASISLGSHRIVTINFMRILLESKTLNEFFKTLDERILSAGKILKAHKDLITNLKNQGLQQFISYGWINMNRLFSTFGILGIYEASERAKEKYSLEKKYDFTKEVLLFMNQKVSEYTKQFGIIGNIEQIPAESMAKRLPKIDSLLYGETKVPYTLYANQFIPLWEEASIWERFEIDGKYSSLITGGGICHGTIGEKITSKQAEKLIKHAVDSGCSHFALNAIYSCCKEHTVIGKLETCPICNEKIIDYITRVIGYFVNVSAWNQERREWEFPKRKLSKIE